MKKVKSSLLAGGTALFFLWGGIAKTELKDIVKPYLGVYECTDARLGGVEWLNRFDTIHLELKADDTFLLHYAEKGGEKRTQEGSYTYDKEKSTITLQGGGFERAFPLINGVLTVVVPLGGQTVKLTFKQK